MFPAALMEMHFQFYGRLKILDSDETVITLLMVISLFSDNIGLVEREEISRIQIKYAELLRKYLFQKHDEKKGKAVFSSVRLLHDF